MGKSPFQARPGGPSSRLNAIAGVTPHRSAASIAAANQLIAHRVTIVLDGDHQRGPVVVLLIATVDVGAVRQQQVENSPAFEDAVPSVPSAHSAD